MAQCLVTPNQTHKGKCTCGRPKCTPHAIANCAVCHTLPRADDLDTTIWAAQQKFTQMGHHIEMYAAERSAGHTVEDWEHCPAASCELVRGFIRSHSS